MTKGITGKKTKNILMLNWCANKWNKYFILLTTWNIVKMINIVVINNFETLRVFYWNNRHCVMTWHDVYL